MDKAASTLAKLKNKSKQTGISLQMHLQLFCQEEFLRKLSMSKYADNFVLKGGMFIYTLTNFESRSTMDVDFLLRQLPHDIETIKTIITEILAVDTDNDFIELTAQAFDNIALERKYPGVSCKIIGKIKNTRTPFNVDIGVGDIIVPSSEKRRIPVQISDFQSPEINTYSLESTIAEKLDAILQRLEMTSRMKDFYDIYYLSNSFNFEGNKLKEAITQTLKNRGTKYNADSLNQIAGFTNDSDMLIKWKHALRNIKKADLEFEAVISEIVDFLTPIWSSIIAKEDFSKDWDKSLKKWS